MPWTSRHLEWLRDTGVALSTSDDRSIRVLEFRDQSDRAIFSSWAKHFRNHYCLDSEIDSLCAGTGLSKTDYLIQIKFPDATVAPGPSVRAGDFAEILLADYVQYVLGYWVPRTRYDRKTIGGESTKGTDVIGFKIAGPQESLEDVLIMLEAKAALTGRPSSAHPVNRLQDAVDDSAKDIWIRKAESLNAIKQRLLDRGDTDGMAKVARFQNAADHPYTEACCAAALIIDAYYDAQLLKATTVDGHPGANGLSLLVIVGQENIMSLVHELYQRAADEA